MGDENKKKMLGFKYFRSFLGVKWWYVGQITKKKACRGINKIKLNIVTKMI